jgi:Tol biopolymer transport system component
MAVWMERGGNTVALRPDPVDWANPRFSADGEQLAFDIHDGKQIDVWLQRLAVPKETRLTLDASDDYKPVLTPDAQRVAFTSTREGVPNLYWQRVDGTGSAERLTRSPNPQAGGSWHPSGRWLAFQETTPRNGSDILILPVEQSGESAKVGTPRVFAGGSFNESEPRFSPDGRWLAYTSNELGRAEVFVRSFESDGKWQISSGGGRDAAWSRARPELVYFSTTENRLMVATYSSAQGAFVLGGVRPWAITPVGRPSRDGRTFDLHPGGDRAVVVPAAVQDADRVNLVFNLFEQLRALAPRN